MLWKKNLWALFLFSFSMNALFAQAPALFSYVQNSKDVLSFLRMPSDYRKTKSSDRIKIAIFDRGFAGMGDAKRYLPESVQVIARYGGSAGIPLDPDHAMGRRLAQLVWNLTGDYNDLTSGPDIRLFNTNPFLKDEKSPDDYYVDPSNFDSAVKEAIAWKADIILCNQNFEVYGNYDGKGPINKMVADADAANIIWIQSAGEYRTRTYDGVVDLQNEFVKFKKKKGGSDISLRLRVWADDASATFTLNWNAISPGLNVRGTRKDLDFFLYAEDGKLIKSSEKKQVLERDQKPGEELPEAETLFPFEAFRATGLMTKRQTKGSAVGNYLLKVRVKGGEFSPEQDRLRITVMSDRPPFFIPDDKRMVDPVELVDFSEEGSMMIPSDSPKAVTVGTLNPWSSIGYLSEPRPKADLTMDNGPISFSDGEKIDGPAVAAAEIAAMAVLMKTNEPLLRPEDFRNWVGRLRKENLARIYENPEKTKKRYEDEGWIFGEQGMKSVFQHASSDKILMKALSNIVQALGSDIVAYQKNDALRVGVRKPLSKLNLKKIDTGKIELVELPEYISPNDRVISARWRTPTVRELKTLVEN